MTDTSEPSYIDYEAFLSPSFSAPSFANSLVLATNDPSDTPLDLSTPLSRVLFDVQEIDTHIDTLTTKSALPLLQYTKDHVEASKHVLQEVESRVASLTDGYKRLEKEVIERHEAAEQVRLAAERLCQTVKIGRSVARCLLLGRQLEAQMSELTGSLPAGGKREDHRAMVRSANTLLSLRQLFAANRPGEEGDGLDRINVVTTLRSDLIGPLERTLLTRAQQIIREFSTSSLLASNASQLSTYTQTEDTKSRATSALTTLYLLSPTMTNTTATHFEPILLVSALQNYLQTALTSSLAALTRALATLPTLDRALLEISARCQNIVALEALLESIKPPPHPLLTDTVVDVSKTVTPSTPAAEPLRNFLQPLLAALDTSSLPSYFWRSLASALSSQIESETRSGNVSIAGVSYRRARRALGRMV
ncbi:hypothetical protein B0A49_05940 [Cryomyces minteri]|uniref:Conserved oligomeric Golgi complex subunit 5 n=1 Tax=Cryomyces minteri TaxID=331657 RepID=A0A4U0WDH8_9PEZI|nr:hypothetical protein B0A49_05940 [Cryomyces minteri]